ncbi:MAG: amidohydrolase family protein, partial [Armatimonadota bacterium]|nr:amidohydrolase family protein [Armatimonadota bacterium]
AVRAYTLGAAYSAFAERELGSLEVAKWADFVVLDRDPFQVDPEDIAKVRVLRTVVGGRCVYPSADASD